MEGTKASGCSHAEEIYKEISRTDRRKTGIFFSGTEWADVIYRAIPAGAWHRFIDPNVGIGDLLSRIVADLPLSYDFRSTVTRWRSTLAGTDIEARFADLAWARILQLLKCRIEAEGMEVEIQDLEWASLRSPFTVGDFLRMKASINPGDCVVMNPPFQLIKSEGESVSWGSGLKSAASLHLSKVLESAPDGVAVVALIPDVIRSGSSYRKFREYLGFRMDVHSFEPQGNFGSSADVDVALLVGITRKKIDISTVDCSHVVNEGVLGREFMVSVGPVVPHRTGTGGARRPYFTARTSLDWSIVKKASFTASYDARAFKGPFVLIKRTSSPSDKYRAKASIVDIREEVLVENHLIVCRPKDGRLDTCKKLMASLKTQYVNEWLNSRIRCRHLTVAVIKEMPIGKG